MTLFRLPDRARRYHGFAMRRRDLFALPAAAALPAPAFSGAPRVAVVELSSATPLEELASAWTDRRLPDPVRVVARAHPAWWPSPHELPACWRAWFDLPDGTAVVAVRSAHPATRPESVPPLAAARRLAAALTSAASWPA